jgi:uncharacterized protein YbjT (DUF2867 family)
VKLTIFGSTGGVGRHLVHQALEQGHEVTALTRAPAKLERLADFARDHGRLRVVAGDVLDPEAVREAVAGADAVVCALGMPLFNRDRIRTRGTANILAAMQAGGVRRLACLSAFGVGESWTQLPAHYRLFIIPLFMRHVYADHEAQEAEVRLSDLDWTIVRPGSFTDGPRSGSYWHGTAAAAARLRLKISREDVADFLLRQVDDDRYLHAAPGLSY